MLKSLASGAALATRAVADELHRDGRAGGRQRPRRRGRMFRAVVGRHQVLQVPEEGRALPDRARQRLHRQHLAHPDDPDGEGLRGAAGRRGEAEGIQGRVDRRGRPGADLGDQQLHRFRLRRDRRQRPEPDRLRAGDQARQGGRRHPRRLRQHPRHAGRHQRQRRPERPRQPVGRLARQAPAGGRQDPGGPRRRRHLRRHRPPRRHSRDARRHRQAVGGHRGGRQVGRPDGAEGDGRRHRRPQGLRRHHRPGRRHRRGAGDARRQARDGAVRRRDRERLPQVLRGVLQGRAEVLVRRHRPGAGRRRHQDRDRRPRRPGGAAVGEAAARHRGRSELQGRRGLLPRRVGQLLRRQLLPDLPGSISPRRRSWARRSRTSSGSRRPGRRGTVPRRLRTTAGLEIEMDGIAEAAAPLFRMEAISKRYGGVRALEKADLTVFPGRIHAVLGEERRRQVDLDQGDVRRRRPRRGADDDGRARRRLRLAGRGEPGRHRLRLPGAVARPGPVGRRQRGDQRPRRPASG